MVESLAFQQKMCTDMYHFVTSHVATQLFDAGLLPPKFSQGGFITAITLRHEDFGARKYCRADFTE